MEEGHLKKRRKKRLNTQVNLQHRLGLQHFQLLLSQESVIFGSSIHSPTLDAHKIAVVEQRTKGNETAVTAGLLPKKAV